MFFLNTSTYSQTLTLQCLGTKTMLLSDGKYRSWENYTQTYIIKDGMIDGKSPEPSVGNLLYYQLTPTTNLNCQNFCNHRVEINGITNEIYDTNFSLSKGVKQNWQYRGICSNK